MNVLILFDSWFGNTEIAGRNIADGVREAENSQVEVRRVNSIPDGEILDFDAVLIGSPNHMGRPTSAAVRQIRRLHNLDTRSLKFGVFDTCFGSQMGLATKKMAGELQAATPKAELLSPELSVVVDHFKGPLGVGELIRCREFGERLVGACNTPPSRLVWERA